MLNTIGGLFFHLCEDVAYDLWRVVGRFWGTRDLWEKEVSREFGDGIRKLWRRISTKSCKNVIDFTELIDRRKQG